MTSTSTSCGLSWCGYPQFLQRFANTKTFILVYGLLGTFQAMGYIYFVITLQTMEKRFKIPSQTTGNWRKSVANWAQFNQSDFNWRSAFQAWSWVATRSRRFFCRCFWLILEGSAIGRGLSRGVSCSARSRASSLRHHIFFMALAMMRWDWRRSSLIQRTVRWFEKFLRNFPSFFNYLRFQLDNSEVDILFRKSNRLCMAEPVDQACENEIESLVPLILIFLSQFVLGIGNTLYYALGQTYLDDNTKKTNTPLLLSYAFTLRTFGPGKKLSFTFSQLFSWFFRNCSCWLCSRLCLLKNVHRSNENATDWLDGSSMDGSMVARMGLSWNRNAFHLSSCWTFSKGTSKKEEGNWKVSFIFVSIWLLNEKVSSFWVIEWGLSYSLKIIGCNFS